VYANNATSPPPNGAGAYSHDGYGANGYSNGYSQGAYQDGYGQDSYAQDGYSGDYSYGSQQQHQPYSDTPAPVWGSGYTGAAAAAAAAPSMHSHSGSAGGASQWDGNTRHSIGGVSSNQPYSDQPQQQGGPMTPLQSAAASKAAEAGLYRSDGGPRHSRQLSSHSGVIVYQDGGRPLPATASTSAEGGSSEDLPPPSYQ
jgi:hypothetical protein